jgi:hypothetical protein
MDVTLGPAAGISNFWIVSSARKYLKNKEIGSFKSV